MEKTLDKIVTAKVGEVIAETNHSEGNWSQAILSNLMYANNRWVCSNQLKHPKIQNKPNKIDLI